MFLEAHTHTWQNGHVGLWVTTGLGQNRFGSERVDPKKGCFDSVKKGFRLGRVGLKKGLFC
ncbi:hypothetical protein Hanom_Chr13g01245091 [Helianthus anomalus]